MKNKADFIKDLTNEELKDRIQEETQLYTRLKMNHSVSQIENPLKLRLTRRLIAKLKTEQTKRELSAKK